MKRTLILTLFSILFLSMYAVQPYCRIGQSTKTVRQLTAEVTKLLMDRDFEVLGLYHPNDNADLCVLVFTCDELNSMATSVNNKGAFGATLKVGLIGKGDTTDITLLNPHYLKHAYFGASINRSESLKMIHMTDSLVREALRPLSDNPIYYGRDIPKDELRVYHFLPMMPQYQDAVKLGEYDEYIEAVATIKGELLHDNGCELVYELCFDDKEITIFGIAFQGENNPDEAMLKLMGVDCIASMPIEILVQGNKAYMLDGKYRIPLFKSDLSRFKLFKIIELASDIKSCVEKSLKLVD